MIFLPSLFSFLIKNLLYSILYSTGFFSTTPLFCRYRDLRRRLLSYRRCSFLYDKKGCSLHTDYILLYGSSLFCCKQIHPQRANFFILPFLFFSSLFPVGSRASGCIPSPARLLYDPLKISKNVSAPQRYLGPLHGAERHVKKVRNTKYLP